MSNTYTNYWHGDLGEPAPGYDEDFNFPHLDDPRINDGCTSPEVMEAVIERLLEGAG
jgi:hypothetical protein